MSTYYIDFIKATTIYNTIYNIVVISNYDQKCFFKSPECGCIES